MFGEGPGISLGFADLYRVMADELKIHMDLGVAFTWWSLCGIDAVVVNIQFHTSVVELQRGTFTDILASNGSGIIFRTRTSMDNDLS